MGTHKKADLLGMFPETHKDVANRLRMRRGKNQSICLFPAEESLGFKGLWSVSASAVTLLSHLHTSLSESGLDPLLVGGGLDKLRCIAGLSGSPVNAMPPGDVHINQVSPLA